jgi:hypothetical protein
MNEVKKSKRDSEKKKQKPKENLENEKLNK